MSSNDKSLVTFQVAISIPSNIVAENKQDLIDEIVRCLETRFKGGVVGEPTIIRTSPSSSL